MQNNEPNEQKKNDEFEKPEVPDAWAILAERKKRGLWKGEIEIVQTKEYNLTKGGHYYIIDDAKAGSVRCTLCQIPHGGVLESHLLHRYSVKNGIIYLDGKPVTQLPPK